MPDWSKLQESNLPPSDPEPEAQPLRQASAVEMAVALVLVRAPGKDWSCRHMATYPPVWVNLGNRTPSDRKSCVHHIARSHGKNSGHT